MQVDIHDTDGLKSLFENTGPVNHILGVATGAERVMAPFMTQTDEEFRGAFNKFWGYTNLARQGIPFLEDNGSLTFVSGTPARKCNPGMSSVSCTGSAVEGLTRALALELAAHRHHRQIGQQGERCRRPSQLAVVTSRRPTDR